MSTESIIRDRPSVAAIHTIYFYYIYYPLGNPQADPVMRVYYQHDHSTPIKDEDDLKGLVSSLAWNARIGDFVPPPCGSSFSSVPWRKRAYIVLMVDDPVHKFSDTDNVTIDFTGFPEEVNHSFFNARLMTIDAGGEELTAFYCTNLMLNMQDRELQFGEFEKFHFTIRPPKNRALLYRDDGGTNQGGPIPPLIDA
ncbi:hypothetical protein [Allosphingosinicella sp.]|uniref:hypothetical protein n=1 Tax=Allosphingosinicella sp. TaxID=2823234 RepID=UPI0037837044